MKEFFTKIKVKYNISINWIKDKIEKIDSKTNPEIGYKIYYYSRWLTILLILLGIPVLGVIFGYFILAGGPSWVAIVVMYPMLAIFLTSILSWFWFSKFNDYKDLEEKRLEEAKIITPEEKRNKDKK